MFDILKFYGRHSAPVLIGVIALLALHLAFDIGWINVMHGALIVAVFRWNAEDRSNKTWRFFHSLPISFSEKVVCKIILPFVFLLVVYVAKNKTSLPAQVFDGSLNEASLAASALILASLLGHSMFAAIVWFGAFLGIALILPNSGVITILGTSAYLAAAVYHLSEKRIAFNSLLLRSAAICVPLLVVVHYARVPALNRAISSKSSAMRVLAADQLLEEGNSDAAVRALAEVLLTENDSKILKHAVSVLDKQDLNTSISKERWLSLMATDRDLRQDILNYMSHNKPAFQWLDVEFFQIAELDTFMSKRCKDDCRALARLAGELAAGGKKDIDTYIRSRLKSVQDEKILFALNAVQYANVDDYQAEILALVEHRDREVRELSEDLLKDLVGNSVDLSKLGSFLDSIDADLTDLEKKKLRELIEEVVLPNLKIVAELP